MLVEGFDQTVNLGHGIVVDHRDPDDPGLSRQAQLFDQAAGVEIAVADADPVLVHAGHDFVGAVVFRDEADGGDAPAPVG